MWVGRRGGPNRVSRAGCSELSLRCLLLRNLGGIARLLSIL